MSAYCCIELDLLLTLNHDARNHVFKKYKFSTSSKPLLVDLTSLISDLATFMTACGQCSASLTDKGLHVTLQDLPGIPTDPRIPGASIRNEVLQGHSKGSQYSKVYITGCQIHVCSCQRQASFEHQGNSLASSV